MKKKLKKMLKRKGPKKGMKDHEVDFYRWLAYGMGLLFIALGAIFYGPLMYIFAVVFVIAVFDIFYHRYFKYSALGRSRR